MKNKIVECPECGSINAQFIEYGELVDFDDEDAEAIYYNRQEHYMCRYCGEEFEVTGTWVDPKESYGEQV